MTGHFTNAIYNKLRINLEVFYGSLYINVVNRYTISSYGNRNMIRLFETEGFVTDVHFHENDDRDSGYQENATFSLTDKFIDRYTFEKL